MDTTVKTLSNFIKENKKSDPTHSTMAKMRLEAEASGYLVTSIQRGGKGFVASYCRQEANKILSALEWASK